MKYKLVKKKVEELYKKSNQEFGLWMWQNHVTFVAKKTEELCTRYGANLDIAVAGAYLHDLADAVMDRFDEGHEEISNTEARRILKESDYSDDEIEIIMNEVIAPHSCKDGIVPNIIEGKALATADAMAHLLTDFYIEFCWMHIPRGLDFLKYKNWAFTKMERDYQDKIFFEEIKKEVTQRYESLRRVFK